MLVAVESAGVRMVQVVRSAKRAGAAELVRPQLKRILALLFIIVLTRELLFACDLWSGKDHAHVLDFGFLYAYSKQSDEIMSFTPNREFGTPHYAV